MKPLYLILLSVILLFSFSSCDKKEDPLAGAESKTYYQECLETAMYPSGMSCSKLTILKDNKADMLHLGDIISSGTYSVSGKTLTVTLPDSYSYEFTICSSSELENNEDGSVWKVK